MFFRPRNRVKTKKKRSFPKIEEFLAPKSSKDQKKVFNAIWESRWGALNLDGGTLNVNGGTLTLDGERVSPRPPNNLSTG